MTCPGDQTLAAFVGGGIDDAQRAEVDDHMLACGLCRRSIAALARALPILDTLPQQRSLEDLRAAEGELRRYTIERVIGEGGMGIVVAARDRELQRSVAIKFSRRAANGGLHDEAARARFIREARVLAQLNHPNVITIYDTGVSTGELYIVMELVETGTLRDWLARERRPWRDILDVFVAAGRGLAIAHSAGIVHRDFKPANVLLGSDLRPRVSDFGLARPMERDDASGVVSHPMLALGSSMTDTSGVVGTPLYMAPEQRVGLPSDERTDQYSFCVALYEALYAKHPEPERIATSAVSHPCEGTVPGRIRKAIVRGLAKAPADRWPSMEALLAALTDARTSKRWWFAAGGLVAVVATAAVAFAVMRQSPSDLAALVCQGANQKLDGIWDEPRQGVIQAAFLATGRPSAIKAWSNVDRTLDRYTTAWAAMHSEACRATRVSGEQSEHVLELRMRCLETRRSSLAALVDAMSRPDATTLETVANAADQLSPVDDCANVSALAAVVPPPADPVARAHIDVVLAQLSTAWSLEQTGKPIEALRVARATMEPASQIGYAPLIAQVHEAVGQLARDTDDYKAADQAFYAGLVAAETGKDEVTRAAILIHLARLVAIDLGRLDEGVR
ncbi:MAG: serine/threonine-protein kinase, partial [Kofleriaceae bacterium]